MDQGAEFLFVRGSSEWSAIAREMKHMKIVRAPGKEVGGVKHEANIKDENDAAAERTVIAISDDSDSDTEAGDAAELPDDVNAAMPMDVDDEGEGVGAVNSVSKPEHLKVVDDWRNAHPAAPWPVPPVELAQVLYAHIKKVWSLKDNDKPRAPLPAAVLHHLDSPLSQKWLTKQIVHIKMLPNRKRRVLVDGPIFYDTLVAAHRGSSGNAHNTASTMRKQIGKKFVLGPKSDFYALWVSRCPGCNQ
ncbi:hypothetical protein PENSPDRAFT_659635 [Peniophora sp. CONT]|nr:hypothetical protein PENSPDRAFT_659635 [Peniophora sp. CONT]